MVKNKDKNELDLTKLPSADSARMVAKKPDNKGREWWRHAIIYQIYPRSFQDSNGDGIGDIPGIISRLDYLVELGIDAIWLSPVYLSPNNDYGYDIADYTAINPEYGTMADMDRLIAEAGKRGLKIIMDLVINHTSDQHKWFKASRDPKSPYRNYYIWRNGKPGTGKKQYPNNWTSIFTGPAWTKDEKSGQYYLHLFTPQQPDLNYHNPEVVKEIEHVLNFWLDKGVAGFRCDVINLLYEESLKDSSKVTASGTGSEFFVSTPGTHRVLQKLHRDVLAPRRAFTVGELYNGSISQGQAFTAGDELDAVFLFNHAKQGMGSRNMTKRLKAGLIDEQTKMPWNTIFFENHDQQRAPSVYGKPGYEVETAKMIATLLFTLRGTPFVYQGQELGMSDIKLALDQIKDPVGLRIYQTVRSYGAPKFLARQMGLRMTRDYARTPMQWDDTDNAGFSDGPTTWLPVNPNYRDVSVLAEEDDADSVLKYYQQLIALRKSNLVLQDGAIRFLDDKKYVLSYLRTLGERSILVVVNLSHRKVQPLTQLTGRMIVSSNSAREDLTDQTLQPYEAVVMEV